MGMAHVRHTKSAPKLHSKQEVSSYWNNPENRKMHDYHAEDIARRAKGGKRTRRHRRRR
jgi:hypothetical protein